MATESQHYDIVEHNLAGFAKELASRLLDGWVISKTNPGDVVGLFGGTFTVSMHRNADTVQALKEKAEAVQSIAKPSRGDILVKARAARAEKAVKKATGKS